jgi:hypothetical protein
VTAISTQEQWLPVVGYDGYEVSDRGRVRSIDRIVEVGSGSRSVTGRLLSLGTNNSGYRNVGMGSRKAGRPIRVSVHKLVAEAFIGPRPSGMDINHIDGQKDNNRCENLEYVTHRNNQQHAMARFKAGVGPRMGKATVSEDSVRRIRALRSEGKTLATIAAEFGIRESTVCLICKRRTWAHVA